MTTDLPHATLLVTGARGYIGGRLVQYLASRGRNVIGTSRSDSPPPVGWPSDVPLLPLDPLGNLAAATATLSGVETVIHLAAANEIRSVDDPDGALIETGAGTRRLIEASTSAGVKRFIFLSTVHVYGSPLRGLVSEADIPRPSHPYAITHQIGEAFTLAANSAGRIEGIAVRLTNVIGAPAWVDVDRWSLLGNDLARQAVYTGKIVIRTPGQWRDFITIPDVCRGIDLLIRAPAEMLRDGVVNLGSGTTSRVDDVAARLAHVANLRLGRSIVLECPDSSKVIPCNPPFTLSIERICGLGFTPSGIESFDAELDETVALLDKKHDGRMTA